MQTFLPYPDFIQSAQCLDDVRLMNQRNEAQIICAHVFPLIKKLNCRICWDKGSIPSCPACGVRYKPFNCRTCKDKGGIPECPTCKRQPGPIKEMTGWRHHPAVKMWREWRWALLAYAFDICVECRRRGFDDTVYDKLKTYGCVASFSNTKKGLLPTWFGDPRFHDSHKSNLLRKDPEWYSQFGWSVRNDLEYWWPVK